MAASNSAGRSAIVVVVDRLGAGFLGPYGNTWLDTPQICRLASQSLLFETALADAVDLPTIYRSYLTGRHAFEPRLAQDAGLAELARSAGLRTLLVTDEQQVAEHPLAEGFAERVVVLSQAAQHGEEFGDTAIGRLTLAASERLSALREPALVWIHSRAMAGPWDAPLELRLQFADEDDPLPPDLIEPPERKLSEGADPDEVLGLVHAYAGQVALWDAGLGVLLDTLDEHPLAGQTLVAFTSPRGYPLGEHRRVGACDQALFGELLQVPLMIRVPEGNHERTQRLVQPGDLFATLADWLQLPGERPGFSNSLLSPTNPGQIACALGPRQRAIRTPAWFLRETLADDGEPSHELFAKPDDRWEANEVSSRCGEVVELLAAQLTAFEAAAGANQLADLPPVAELLTDVWR